MADLPELRVDNPGGEWLQGYVDSARKTYLTAPEGSASRNLGSDGDAKVTGYWRDASNRLGIWNLSPDLLKDIPGAMGEENFRNDSEKLRRLQKTIKKSGYDPSQATILIQVREDGKPFIVEGNHRVAEGLLSGRSTIPVEIQYLRGGEVAEGLLSPERLRQANEPRPTDQSKLPAVIDAASVASQLARTQADDPRPKGKGSVFRGVGSLMRSRVFPLIQAVQMGYKLLPEDKQVAGDVLDYLEKTKTHELFGLEKSGLEYFKDFLGLSDSEPEEDSRLKAFQELANLQRQEPETAMVEARNVLGGGVLSFAIEHTGDLTNRMADKYDFFEGYGYDVGNKVRKVLSTLRNEYGFEKEHRDNIRSNADYDGISEKELQDASTKALQKYADAHKKLKVYNEPQKWARDAAVALGEQRFGDAEKLLSKLENLIKTDPNSTLWDLPSGSEMSESYREAAGKFDPEYKAAGGFVDKPLYEDARMIG
jgi:hypothetical protein